MKKLKKNKAADVMDFTFEHLLYMNSNLSEVVDPFKMKGMCRIDGRQVFSGYTHNNIEIL